MGKNKISIGRRMSDEYANKPVKDAPPKVGAAAPPIAVADNAGQDGLYIWDTDRELEGKIEEEYLQEKRHYVRVGYIKPVECGFYMDDIEGELKPLKRPLEFMTCDISMSGMGVVSEHIAEPGIIYLFKVNLDGILYEVLYQVVYCVENEGRYRVGLRHVNADRAFLRHLKIYVARISLESTYGSRVSGGEANGRS